MSVKTVAFLQNMWFKDPERARKLLSHYEKREPEGKGRERFIRDFLFFGCLTGKRLDTAFGGGDWEYRYNIIWEEVSPQIGGHASSCFPLDPGHIRRVLQKHQPQVVILFGKVAAAGFEEAVRGIQDRTMYELILAPHPAARGPDVLKQLKEVASRYHQALYNLEAEQVFWEKAP